LQIAREKLIALGTCIGKFTHTGKFKLTIGCLDVLSQYAKYKVRLWKKERKKERLLCPVMLNSIQS
jgi:ribosome biogenesis protein Nip4